MFRIGDVCLKIAGRDAGLVGVVVKIEENGYLLLDGQVRRRAVNPIHVEPIGRNVKIKENATHEEVVEALKKLGIEVKPRGEPKQHGPRPRKQRKISKKKEEKEREKKKVVEKQEKEEQKTTEKQEEKEG
ncbi:KOW motif-containing protein [Candidatus Woesearchaeota archaeon]|nr:KOW motif-containing protein [Candidatus Woesearchaeota archaeon]